MKARLMKYAASTRPTVIRNRVKSRPCASGWRATQAISWLPAIPSPMAAPIAPPPRMSPPPMSAPAIVMSLPSTATVTPLSMFPSMLVANELQAEICNREQRENDRLDHADERVEQFPDDIR